MWDDAAFRPLPRAALQIRLIGGAFAALLLTAVLVAVDVVVLRRATDLEPPVAAGVLPAIVGVVALAAIEAGTWLGWRATGWRLDDRLFAMRAGVYTREWTGVPRDRVQSVLVSTNPLQRWRGLATVTVRTAGAHTPAVVLSDVEESNAEHLRAELAPARAASEQHA